VKVGTEGEAPTSERLSRSRYDRQIAAVREIVHGIVPSNATVLVVSRGDDQLLELGPRRALHFPQNEEGAYAGYHPADSDEAIALLENMRARGAEFLVLPSVAFWWLDYYDAFRQYVEHRYRLVEAGEHSWIAALTESSVAKADQGSGSRPSTSPAAEELEELLGSLLPEDAATAILTTSEQHFAGLDGYETWLVPRKLGESPEGVGSVVTRLEQHGVRFVVVPKGLFGWMDAHPDLADHLQERHRLVTRQAHLCEVYELRHKPQPVVAQPVLSSSTAGPGKGNGRARSFGESVKGVLFRARRNDRRS
jgi:hypothetical protein